MQNNEAQSKAGWWCAEMAITLSAMEKIILDLLDHNRMIYQKITFPDLDCLLRSVARWEERSKACKYKTLLNCNSETIINGPSNNSCIHLIYRWLFCEYYLINSKFWRQMMQKTLEHWNFQTFNFFFLLTILYLLFNDT